MSITTITLSGSRYAIGTAQGRRIAGLRLPKLASGSGSFPDDCRAAVQRWHPAILDEYEGMLSASGLPDAEFASYYFGRTAPLAGGCTNLAVLPEVTSNGQLIVGRNYDWAYVDRRWCEARYVSPSGEHRRVGYTHHWGGLCDGMNEAGLTICIASLPSAGESLPGIQWHIVVDMVLTQCDSVAAAVKLLTSIPHVRSIAYLVADESNAAIVEASSSRIRIRRPHAGILVGTNHWTTEGPSSGPRGAASVARRKQALALLTTASPSHSLDTVRSVLSDHHGGICAGDHPGECENRAQQGKSGTIWSLIARPEMKSLFVAPGHPCITPYETLPLTPHHT